MKPLLYILRKNLKNSLKELKHKPVALVLNILFMLVFIGMIVISVIMPTTKAGPGSLETYSAIITAALLFIVYSGIKKGIDSGGSFFRLADVNLVFTAPISPKKVLIYGFIKQLFTTLFILMFVAFQIPNLKNHYTISSTGLAIIYAGAFFLFISMELLGVILYSLASKSQRARAALKRALDILTFAVLGGLIINVLRTKDLIRAAVEFLGSSYFNYVPFIGWFRAVLVSSVKGFDTSFYVSFILVLAFFALMLTILYKLNTDYYEDVLAATEKKETLISAKREGRTNTDALSNVKVRKAHQKYSGSGAKSIFYKQMLEFKKTGFFFINRNSLFVVGFGIASKYFFPYSSIKSVLYFTVYMLFILSFQAKWAQELNKPFIYLFPFSSSSKVFYATLTDNIKNAIDGLILFIIAGYMFKADALTIILSVLAYTTSGAIFVYGDVLARRFLGEVHSKNLSILLRMLLILFVILPGYIISIVFLFVFKNVPNIDYYSYMALIVYNIFASGIILIFSKGIFEYLEMN